MTFAFVINQLIVGGAEQYVITKSEWLINKGHNVIIISEGGIWENRLPASVKHFKLNGLMSSPYVINNKDYSTFKEELAGILIDNKVDLIEGQNTWPIIHIINSYNLHKIPFYENILNELSLNKNPLLQYATIKLDKVNLYFTLTSKMNRYIEQQCKKKLRPSIINIPFKHNNIDISDKKYILSVSRMSCDKMYVKSLILGFTALVIKDHTIDHNLIIVGDGELFREVSYLAEQSNNKIGKERIFLTGTVTGPDLERLFSSCSVYVGMGTTLLMAASMKKPCIRCGFEPVTMAMAWGFWGEDPDSHKDEIVFSSYDQESKGEPYENILQRILTNSQFCEKMGKKSYDLYKKTYSLDLIMSKWETEYKRILSKNNHNELDNLQKKIQKASSIMVYLYKIYTIGKRFKVWKR